ncbi:MAG: response regulator [Desulfobacterales bacterium]|nr:response regulator [Desulfobacterales bacterium]MBF0395630.1 response regulator [Desulfobacterales bacterium]
MLNQAGPKQKILIIDDVTENILILIDLLKSHYITFFAKDGKKGIELAKSKDPDLILLDIIMPEIDGYQVCKILKESKNTQNIPVIFISAQSEIIDKIKAFTSGGVDYITKPFEAEEVLARVNTHISIRCLQNQIILNEKMAALGQLIAGIAHEINTPLGVIKASIGNIENALQNSILELPKLFQTIEKELQHDFFDLLKKAQNNKEIISTKEERKLKRSIKEFLDSQNISESDTVSGTLIKMGITDDISLFINLLKSKDNIFILKTAYDLFIQKSNSQNIKSAVERVSKIVFALKSYSRYDENATKTLNNITDGIDLVLTIYQNELKRGILVVKNYTDLPEIWCYSDELTQVWTNLIHNAIYAMGGVGELKISTFKQDNFVVVEINDSGHGIPDNIKDRIFEPFFTTKPTGEGSGLGLDIARKIINRHQGKIEFESIPGKTIFRVFLPLEGE